MRYFDGIRTAEEAKQRYHELAKRLHPDNGGNAEEFKAMQAEFSELWNRVKGVHRNAEGKEYHSETSESASAYMKIVDIVLRMEGVDLELCGAWLWATGRTYQHRETFKGMGFRWSKSKRAWYYSPEGFTGKRKGFYTLNEIRQTYGSEKFQRTGQKTSANQLEG